MNKLRLNDEINGHWLLTLRSLVPAGTGTGAPPQGQKKQIWVYWDHWQASALYAKYGLSIQQILTELAALSYIVTAVHRMYKTDFIPNQLFYDIQSTIMDVYFTVAKLQNIPGEEIFCVPAGQWWMRMAVRQCHYNNPWLKRVNVIADRTDEACQHYCRYILTPFRIQNPHNKKAEYRWYCRPHFNFSLDGCT